MISLPSGTQVWVAAGVTDMRKGFDTLCALVQTALEENPFFGQMFVFRGKRGSFPWPHAKSGAVSLSSAQLSMLLEGIDWRRPVRKAPRPELSA